MGVAPDQQRVAGDVGPAPARDGTDRLGRILLLAVLASAAGLHFFYLAANRTPQHWDPAQHVLHSIEVAEGLSRVGLPFLRRLWTSTYTFYPPGYYLATAPAFLLIGHSIKAAIAWQIVYLLGTLGVLSWLIAWYHGARWGALGAAVYLGFPIALGFSRMTYIENLLALEVVSTVALAMPLRAIERPGRAVLLGLLLGYGQMTKWQFVLYVCPFLALAFASRLHSLRGLGADPGARRRLCACALAAAAAALLVCGPWYAAHGPRLLQNLHFHAYVREMGDAPLLSAQALFYYLQALPGQMIGVPLSALLLVSIAVSLTRRGARREPAIWALSLAATLLLLSFAKHKEGRFLLPMLPLCAALLVGGIAALPRGPRALGLSAVLFFAALNAFTQTLDASAWRSEIYVPIGFERRGYVLRYGTPEWLMLPVQRNGWAVDEIFEEIQRRAAQEGVEASVSFRFKDEHPYYNPTTFLSHVRALRLRWARRLADANFTVARPDRLFEDGDVVAGRRLEQLRTWTLPDGSAVGLYRSRRR